MEKQIVIDGTHATLGRLSSYAAKQALLGNKIVIVNANEVVLIGPKNNLVDHYKTKVSRGGTSLKGSKMQRSPERILKRTIRGMLSHKQGRGSQALDNIMCYNETPAEYKEVKKIIAGKEKTGKFMTLRELAGLIK